MLIETKTFKFIDTHYLNIPDPQFDPKEALEHMEDFITATLNETKMKNKMSMTKVAKLATKVNQNGKLSKSLFTMLTKHLQLFLEGKLTVLNQVSTTPMSPEECLMNEDRGMNIEYPQSSQISIKSTKTLTKGITKILSTAAPLSLMTTDISALLYKLIKTIVDDNYCCCIIEVLKEICRWTDQARVSLRKEILKEENSGPMVQIERASPKVQSTLCSIQGFDQVRPAVEILKKLGYFNKFLDEFLMPKTALFYAGLLKGSEEEKAPETPDIFHSSGLAPLLPIQSISGYSNFIKQTFSIEQLLMSQVMKIAVDGAMVSVIKKALIVDILPEILNSNFEKELLAGNQPVLTYFKGLMTDSEVNDIFINFFGSVMKNQIEKRVNSAEYRHCWVEKLSELHQKVSETLNQVYKEDIKLKKALDKSFESVLNKIETAFANSFSQFVTTKIETWIKEKKVNLDESSMKETIRLFQFVENKKAFISSYNQKYYLSNLVFFCVLIDHFIFRLTLRRKFWKSSKKKMELSLLNPVLNLLSNMSKEER